MSVKKLFTMAVRDLVLSVRNALVWVLFGTVVLMIAVVLFVMPKERGVSRIPYTVDMTEGRSFESKPGGAGPEYPAFVRDRSELVEKVSGTPHAIGAILTGTPERLEAVFLHTGRLGEKSLNALAASLEALVGAEDSAVRPEVQFIRERIAPVPPHLALVPVLLVFEVLILGFILAAVFIFQEKNEGSIRAYRIAPGGTAPYIASKVAAFLVIGILYGSILVLFTMGFGVNYPGFLAVTVVCFVLYTLIGMTTAVFFNSISEWFFIGMTILLVNMAPIFSHEFPSFSPGWIEWFPSYVVLRSYDELLFPSGRNLLPSIALLAAETVAAYFLCSFAVERKLMKEGTR